IPMLFLVVERRFDAPNQLRLAIRALKFRKAFAEGQKLFLQLCDCFTICQFFKLGTRVLLVKIRANHRQSPQRDVDGLPLGCLYGELISERRAEIRNLRMRYSIPDRNDSSVAVNFTSD